MSADTPNAQLASWNSQIRRRENSKTIYLFIASLSATMKDVQVKMALTGTQETKNRFP